MSKVTKHFRHREEKVIFAVQVLGKSLIWYVYEISGLIHLFIYLIHFLKFLLKDCNVLGQAQENLSIVRRIRINLVQAISRY